MIAAGKAGDAKPACGSNLANFPEHRLVDICIMTRDAFLNGLGNIAEVFPGVLGQFTDPDRI